MPVKLRHAAAYIRVSTEDQIEYSPESQLRMIKDYALRNGYEISDEHIYIDEGISGRQAEKRPAFMEMISVAKAMPKPFDAILVWKFSRFARSRQDSIVYKTLLRRQLGIEVLSVSESLGEDSISILIEALIEAMDEYYSINLAEEVRRGMTERARRGEPLSIAPFGYRLENKQLQVVNSEAEIIVSVFSRFAAGEPLSAILRTLNAANIRTHRGSKIEKRTLEYWLNNPVYVGKIRWNPNGKTGRDFHTPGLIISEGGHRPIISPELWSTVQNRLSSFYVRRPRAAASPSHWLIGLLRCGLCGASMVNCRGYFYCTGKNRGSCSGENGARLNIIEKNFLRAIYVYTGNIPAFIIEKRNNASHVFDFISASRRKLDRIKEAYETGVYTIEEYRSAKSRIEVEITELEGELSSIQKPGCFRELSLYELLTDELASFADISLVVRSFVRDITILGDTMTVNFYA